MCPMTSYPFSDYIKKRHALSLATFDVVQEKLEAKIPADAIPGESFLRWIYEVLGILDTKASALMRLNGVMLAAATFMLAPTSNASLLTKIIITISALPSSISIILCLLIVNVGWPFLGKAGVVKPTETTTENPLPKIDFSTEFSDLESMIGKRTCIYRTAWTLSLIAAAAFIFALVLYAFHPYFN